LSLVSTYQIMTSIVLEILFILLLIVANGIFSMSELAIVSSRKVRLEQWAKEGNRRAKAALKLANNPNNFLATVQIGITLIGILSGAVGGATIAKRLEEVFNSVPIIAPYSENISFTIVVAVITYLSLVIGELAPKRLALGHAEQIASNVAKPMQVLANFGTPLVYLLSASTEAFLKVFGVNPSTEDPITAEEIKELIAQGAEAGMFEESEQEMVDRIFRLGDRPIKALMTPRTEIIWLDLNTPLAETQQEVINSPYSRFPVARENLDECLGIVEIRDFLTACLSGKEIDLETSLHSPLHVAESASALSVLESFKQTGNHIALVTDEYGGVEGLVTINDLLEAIVGTLPSQDQYDEPQIIRRDDGSWLVDGMLSVDELKELLEIEQMPEEEEGNYHTAGGFMMTTLRRIPTSGEHFNWGGFQFEVVDMDGTRVDKVLITAIAPIPEI
jgi:putative hemolysin